MESGSPIASLHAAATMLRQEGPRASHQRRAQIRVRNELFAAYESLTMSAGPKTLSADRRAQLKYVNIADDRHDLRRFPDFLIVGPQRTGTSWLHRELQNHPEILWGRRKELHFFNNLNRKDNPRFVSADLDYYLAQFDRPLRWWIGKHRRCLRAYGKPFRPRIIGEASATYATMSENLIDEVQLLNPDMKIIVMIRNPIERAWSHAKKDLVRDPGRSLDDVSDQEFHAFFSSPGQLRCADYAGIVDRWSQRFGSANVATTSFDEIGTDPKAVTAGICQFIGVSDNQHYATSNTSPVNPTSPDLIPEVHRQFLGKLLVDELYRIDKHLDLRWGGHPCDPTHR